MSRFDWFRTACEVCFVEVPDAEAAGALGIVALVLVIFGLTLVIAEWRSPMARRRRLRLPPLTFPLWLGVMMLYDALIYMILSLSILASPGGIDLWALLLLSGFALVAVITFLAWAREKLRRGQH